MFERGWPPEPRRPQHRGCKRRTLIGTGLCAGGLLMLKWLLDAGIVSDNGGLVLVILATVVATFLLAGPSKRPSSGKSEPTRSKAGDPRIRSSDGRHWY